MQNSFDVIHDILYKTNQDIYCTCLSALARSLTASGPQFSYTWSLEHAYVASLSSVALAEQLPVCSWRSRLNALCIYNPVQDRVLQFESLISTRLTSESRGS